MAFRGVESPDVGYYPAWKALGPGGFAVQVVASTEDSDHWADLTTRKPLIVLDLIGCKANRK